jgi:urea transport system permease protein
MHARIRPAHGLQAMRVRKATSMLVETPSELPSPTLPLKGKERARDEASIANSNHLFLKHRTRLTLKQVLTALLLLITFVSTPACAALDASLVKLLASDDSDQKIAGIAKLGALATPDSIAMLKALRDETVYVTTEGRVLIADADNNAVDPVTGEKLTLPDGADNITINNRLRGALDAADSGLQLLSPDVAVRRAGAKALEAAADVEQLPLIQRALVNEKDSETRESLALTASVLELKSADPAVRRVAAERLADSPNASVQPLLAALAEPDDKGNYSEPDASVRSAAAVSLRSVNSRVKRAEYLGNAFYGISLASILLLAALGLAITFGLMGIINMAHGELLMIGAYSTYLVQSVFRQFFPAALEWYVIAALPVAFIVSAGIGMALERSVIRWLYGRPLETLLATWGISLILQQAVRSIFGAQNVEVSNPEWMSGGITVLGGVVLAWNRIVIVIFALLVVLLVWVLLNRTRLGLFVRAVTQNRRMADCVGVPTGRVDMLTFGLGSGIAGLGGVALSQLGNVGPDLGQNYIVDSFMVVVLGGVGQLAGTFIAALGLGEVNKFLEPVAGAVLAKIMILVVIVLFIQKRPQGLFALKGRSVD